MFVVFQWQVVKNTYNATLYPQTIKRLPIFFFFMTSTIFKYLTICYVDCLPLWIYLTVYI